MKINVEDPGDWDQLALLNRVRYRRVRRMKTMPDPIPRPPKAPPEEPIIRLPDSDTRTCPDIFPPKPDETPDLPELPEPIRRPPMDPALPIIDRAA